jgi:hypothetical protein
MPRPSELAACGIMIAFSKNNPVQIQVLKSRNKEIEFFHLGDYCLDEFVARQTINAG